MSPQPPSVPQDSRESLAILVVDDNTVNTFIAVAMIKALGHRATAVHDGETAVKTVIRERWALVLMDLSMPGMDGLTATERIRTWEAQGGRQARVPIIALTAHTSPNIRSVCMGCGMDFYLAKPLLQEDLVQVISTFGGGRSQTGEFSEDTLMDPVSIAALRALPAGIAQDFARRFARDARIGAANVGDHLASGSLEVADSGIFLRGTLTQVGAFRALGVLDRILGLAAIGHHLQARDLQADLAHQIEATIAYLESQFGASAKQA